MWNLPATFNVYLSMIKSFNIDLSVAKYRFHRLYIFIRHNIIIINTCYFMLFSYTSNTMITQVKLPLGICVDKNTFFPVYPRDKKTTWVDNCPVIIFCFAFENKFRDLENHGIEGSRNHGSRDLSILSEITDFLNSWSSGSRYFIKDHGIYCTVIFTITGYYIGSRDPIRNRDPIEDHEFL